MEAMSNHDPWMWFSWGFNPETWGYNGKILLEYNAIYIYIGTSIIVIPCYSNITHYIN